MFAGQIRRFEFPTVLDSVQFLRCCFVVLHFHVGVRMRLHRIKKINGMWPFQFLEKLRY